jgi:chemotaxis protein CheC
MEQLCELNDLQVDALCEVANIGSGHAATVLSQLTNLRIMINVPKVTACRPEDVSCHFERGDQRVVAVSMRMMGDLTGQTFFVMREDGAKLLADLLLQREPGSGGSLDEMERSSLMEAGNILAGSFMNALSGCVGGVLLPSVPHLAIEEADQIAARLTVHAPSDVLFFVETEFYVDRLGEGPRETLGQLRGGFLFVPDPVSLEILLRGLALA